MGDDAECGARSGRAVDADREMQVAAARHRRVRATSVIVAGLVPVVTARAAGAASMPVRNTATTSPVAPRSRARG